MPTLAASALLGVALLLGPAAFGTAVVAVALVAALDASSRLAAAAQRPVLLVALVPAALLPTVVSVRASIGWDELPLWIAGAVLAMFALVLAFGRRAGVVEGLGATALVALVVGPGATALVLLRDLPGGFRWVLAVLALTAGSAIARHVSTGRNLPEPVAAPVTLAVLAAAAAVALQPPMSPLRAALLALTVLAGAVAAAELSRVLHPGGRARALDAAAPLLLASPTAYLVARFAAL